MQINRVSTQHLVRLFLALALIFMLPANAENAANDAPRNSGLVHSAESAKSEKSYVEQVQRVLQSVKSYPTSRKAAIERPSGDVLVQFVLDRSGAVKEKDIVESSANLLIDEAASQTISRANKIGLPPFPNDAWPGEAAHAFTIRLRFEPAKDDSSAPQNSPKEPPSQQHDPK